MSAAQASTGRLSGPSHAFVMAHLLGCAIGWGCQFLIIKLLQGDVAPQIVASVRAMVAALALGIVVLVLRQSILPRGREWRDWLILGTTNGWIANILVVYALARMDSGPAALIQASGPLLTACLAHLFLPGERLSALKSVGILIGFAGVLFLIGPGLLEGGGTLIGVLAMLGVTLGYASGNIYARIVPQAEPLRLAFGQQIVSGLAATLISLMVVGPAGYAPVLSHGPALLVLGLLCSAMPIWLFMRLITAAGATRASMTGYLIPTVAVILGIVILQEPLVPRQILGGAIVLIGVAIVTGLLRWPVRREAA